MALLSLSLGISASSRFWQVLLGTQSSEIAFVDRIIDAPTVQGLGTPDPTGSYLRVFLVLTVAFLFALGVLGAINGALRRRIELERIERQRSALLMISELALALFLLQLLLGDPEFGSLRLALHLVATGLIGVMALKAVSGRLNRKGPAGRLLAAIVEDDELLAGMVLVAWQLAVALWLLAYKPVSLVGGFDRRFAVAVCIGGVVLGGFVLLAARLSLPWRQSPPSFDRFGDAMLQSGLPLMAMPFMVVVANELQHAWPALGGPRRLGLLLVAILAGLSLFLFIRRSRMATRRRPAGLLVKAYYPLLVATLATLVWHQQFLDLSTGDEYLLGQQILPVQQFVDFGSVPLLDLWPARALSDVAITGSYTMLNGYRGLEMVAWSTWLTELVAHVLLYGVIALTATPLFALLVTILLPVRTLAVSPLATILLPALLWVWATRRPSMARWLALGCGTGLVVVWRPQIGVASLAAVLIVTAIWLWFEHREGMGRALGAAAVALGMVPIALIAWEMFGRVDALEALQRLLGKSSSLVGSVASGQGLVLTGSVVPTLYLFLPAFIMLWILFFSVRRLIVPGPMSLAVYCVALLATASIGLLGRSWWIGAGGLSIHPLLFLLVVALAPFVSARARPQSSGTVGRVWFAGVVIFATVLGLAPGGHLAEAPDSLHLIPDPDSFRLHRWQPGEPRALFTPPAYETVLAALDEELDADATFLDMTHSPLLYVLSGRRYPGREVRTIELAGDRDQSREIEASSKLIEKGLMPLMVFRRWTAPDWRRPVPDEVRLYRLTEFAYQQYVPWKTVGGWELWREPDSRRRRRGGSREVAGDREIVVQDFDLQWLPRVWATQDPQRALQRTEVLSTPVPDPVRLRPGQMLKIPVSEPAASAGYLHMCGRLLPSESRAQGYLATPSARLEYGQVPTNGFRFRLASVSEADNRRRALEVPLLSSPAVHQMRRIENDDRLVFQATGSDPFVFKVADWSEVPVVDEKSRFWVRIRYRSSVEGTFQLFFATKRDRFSEDQSIHLWGRATTSDGDAESVEGPIVTGQRTFRVEDLRIDPPRGARFEILGIEVERRPVACEDYLIRLSTQWRWAKGDTRQLILSTDAPLLIDSIHLRSAD